MSAAAAVVGSGGGADRTGVDAIGDKKKEIAEDTNISDGEDDDRDELAAVGNVGGGESNHRRTAPALDCLAALEEALPYKRGLSRHYDGRSKSFCNLNELAVEDARELGKKEHGINKRRRLLLAHEYAERDGNSGNGNGNSALLHSASMPVCFADGINEEEEDINKNGSSNES